ncbi:hypothetical protein FQR65_LT14722 [Abscondita terminalis]|nr:hypothetical protein FQR65_LT14722 [Abscondita terminalis]
MPEVGHDTEGVRANDEAYQGLHEFVNTTVYRPDNSVRKMYQGRKRAKTSNGGSGRGKQKRIAHPYPIGTVAHKYRTGLTLTYDNVDETLAGTDRYLRKEVVSGAFGEYTYSPNEKFDAILGMRADYNSLYGWFGTPRAQLRYQPVTDLPYVWKRSDSIDGTLSNHYPNPVVVDYENPREIAFYNLTDKSYSNSITSRTQILIADAKIRNPNGLPLTGCFQTGYGDQRLSNT